MHLRYPQRVPLAHLPTSIEPLERLTLHLGGPTISIKRDDQTGLAMGGNKIRKLEFLVADALRQGSDYLITTGAPQSNHCRQTAAAAARAGLGCGLVLRGRPKQELSGNMLLDILLGARLYWTGDRPVEEVVAEVSQELEAGEKKPYFIPKGGSNAIGAVGYVLAMDEALEQLRADGRRVDVMVTATSSGGTQAGLTLGAALFGFEGRVLGISIDQPAGIFRQQVADLADATAAYLGLETGSIASRVEVNDDYIEPGYGVLTVREREAMDLVARLEGILLDPVYTGRAMAGLIDLIRQGAFRPDQKILFWHTGGAPTIFAYGDQLENS